MDTKNINQDQEYQEFQENNQDQFEEQIDNHFAGLAVPIESGVHLSMDSSNQQRRYNAHRSQTDQNALSNQSQASNRSQIDQQNSLHQPQQVAQPQLKLQQTQFQIRSRTSSQLMNQQQQMRPIIRSQLQTQPIVHRSRITINGRQPSPSRFFSDTQPIAVKAISPPKNTALGLSFGPGQGSLQIGQAEGLHSHLVRSRVISQIQRPPILELPSNVMKPQSITFIKSEQSIRQTVSIQNTNQSNRSIQGQLFWPSSRLPSPILRQKTPERRLSPVPLVTINNHQATLIHNPQQLGFQKTTIMTQPHGNFPSMNTNINQNNKQARKSNIETKQIVQQRKIKLSIYLQQFYQILNRSQVVLESIRREGLDHDDEEVLGILNLHNNLYRRFKEAKIVSNLPSNFNFVQNRSRRQENSSNITKSENQKNKPLQQTQIVDLKKLQQRLSNFEEQNKKMHDQVQHLHSQISQLQLQNQDLHQQISTISVNNPIEQEANSELNSYQKTIQSQQAIIKRLEQELIQTHNQPISQQSGSRNVDNSFSSSQFQAQQSKFMAIIDSKQAYINDLQAQIIRHKTQIKSLKQQLLRERNQKNTGFTDVQDIGSTGKVPSGSFQKYQKMLKERDQAIEVLNKKIFQIQEQSDAILEQKDKRMKQLHEQIMSLSEQSQVQAQALTQVEASTKNNKETIEKYKSQIQYLQQSLQQKQILMTRLQNERKSTYNLQKQIQHLKIENDNLIAEIDDREKQRVRTSSLIEELQEKTKKVQSQEEMMLMLQKLKEKEQEVIKLRQTVDLHLANIDGLQIEIANIKEGYRSLQDGLIEQRKQSSQKQSEYNQKLQQLTKKSEEYKKSHQQQTTKLKRLLSQHRNTIKSLQHAVPVPSQQQQQQQQQQQMASPTDFRQQYSRSQIKIFELENTIKQKQNKIKQLQNNMETLKLKINHTNTLSQNQVLANQEVEMLRKKIQEFQRKKTGGSLYRVRDWEAIGIFQQKIVYDLKKENQQLRSMLQQKNNPTHYQPQHRHNQHQNLSQTQQSYLVTIQHRLSEFNKKLTQLIQSPYSGTSSHHHQHSTTLSKQLYSLLQRQRSVMHKQYSRDVEILQARLVDLQRYCAMLEAEGQEEWGNSYLYSKTTRKIEEKGMVVEQMDYYKGKNKQLEERVDVLLHMNKDLKQRLQKYMKPQGQNNIQFYKQQLQKAEKRIKTLQATISELTTQNNQIIQKLHKKVPQFDNSEFQQQINEKSLKIASLNQQISSLQLDIQSLTSHQKILESQIINYKTTISSLQQKLSANNQNNKSLNKKIEDLQSQITQLKMSNQILKAEIQRLREKQLNRNGALESQAAGDRAKVSELMQQIRQLQAQIDNKQHQLTEKNEQINNLTSKISIVDNNYWKQIDKVSQLNQRIRELEIKISELQTLLNNSKIQLQQLQSQLSQKQYENQQSRKSSQYLNTLQQKIFSLQQQNETLKKQLQQCSTTNSRLQSKINSLQQQIQQLNCLLETLKRKILEEQSGNQVIGQQRKIVVYYTEMVRSVLLEVEVLIGEVQVVGGESGRVLGRARQEIKKGLDACCYISQ